MWTVDGSVLFYWPCIHSCSVVTSVSGYLRRPEGASDLLVLELQDAVTCLTWLLGTKLLPLQEQKTHLQQALLKSTLNSNTLINSYIEMTTITITCVLKKMCFSHHWFSMQTKVVCPLPHLPYTGLYSWIIYFPLRVQIGICDFPNYLTVCSGRGPRSRSPDERTWLH